MTCTCTSSLLTACKSAVLCIDSIWLFSDVCVTNKCHFDSSTGTYTYLACIGTYQQELLQNHYVEAKTTGDVCVNVMHNLTSHFNLNPEFK